MLEWKTCLKIGVTAFLIFLAVTYWGPFAKLVGALVGAALPLVVGCAIAYVVNILMSWVEARFLSRLKGSVMMRFKRPLSIIASFVLIIGIVALITRLVVPELKACADLLIAQLPIMADAALTWLESSGLGEESGLAAISDADWDAAFQQISTVVSSGFSNMMGTAIEAVTSVFTGVATAVIALIFSVYLLASKERLLGRVDDVLKRYMSEKVFATTHYVLGVADECFHRFIVGQCAEAVILGVLCTLGMAVLGIPYAAMTGAVIALTALIPVAGAYIGAAIGVLMIITVSPIKAILFVVFIVVLQQIEGNFIYPKVVGSSLGLPAIWVLTAVIVGGGVMGIGGMLIGVPIAATLYHLLREDVYGSGSERTGMASAS